MGRVSTAASLQVAGTCRRHVGLNLCEAERLARQVFKFKSEMALGQVRRAALYPAELRVHPDIDASLDDDADRFNGKGDDEMRLCAGYG